MLDYLSGNVPGGIFVYLLVVITLFLVLFSISRRNDLFTPTKFRWWFAGVFLSLTTIYIGVWLRKPPAEALSRYIVATEIETPGQRWLATWLQEEIESLLPPYIDQNHYLYPASQLPGAAILQSEQDKLQWRQQIASWSTAMAIVAVLKKNGQGWVVQLSGPGQPTLIPLDPENGDAFRDQFRQWASTFLPPSTGKFATGNLPDSLFMIAKAHFYAKEYQKSLDMCVKTRKNWAGYNEIRRLENFNRIRLANMERAAEGSRNPFDQQQRAWQKELQEARAQLIVLIKQNIEDEINDLQLHNMMAETFIQEEKFGEAEEFLKLAYSANPFDPNTLENLSLLHPSRYAPLGYATEKEILERILDLYPAHIPTLTRYVEKELFSVPVKDAATENTRSRINKALRLNPESVEALILKGNFLNAIFQYQKALDAFVSADSLQPGNAIIRYNMGICAFKLDDIQTAEKHFNRAVEIDDYLDAHLYLGVIYQRQQNFEKALAAFRHRVANKTGDNDYYALQAMKGIRECLEALNIPIPQQ